MMCLYKRHARRVLALAGTIALVAGAVACSVAKAGDSPNVGVSKQPLGNALGDLAKACGLGCPGDEDDKGVEIKGIAEGNAAISGVASVDAFFAAVVNFKGAATGVAGGIKGQLDLIRGDFGIAADADLAAQLKAKMDANLEAGFAFKAEPARCSADINATLKAKARCEGEVNPGSVKVECKGGCEVDASAEVMCDANAELVCTFVPPDLKCSGQCQGSCEASIMGSAACSGTCRGTCSGECSAYVKDAQGMAKCEGQCNGMCTGSCEVELAAMASCSGTCKGECTVTDPMGGCKGGIRAECRAEANASVMCDGKCTGEVEPPSAKVQCQASAKAEAKINVQCTPPRVTFAYKFKASVDAAAKAKFDAALQTLVSVRLPALKAAIAKGNSVSEAGAGLASSATGALDGAFEAVVDGDSSIRVKFGVGCAVAELPKVGAVIKTSTDALKTQLDAAGKITSMFSIS